MIVTDVLLGSLVRISYHAFRGIGTVVAHNCNPEGIWVYGSSTHPLIRQKQIKQITNLQGQSGKHAIKQAVVYMGTALCEHQEVKTNQVSLWGKQFLTPFEYEVGETAYINVVSRHSLEEYNGAKVTIKRVDKSASKWHGGYDTTYTLDGGENHSVSSSGWTGRSLVPYDWCDYIKNKQADVGSYGKEADPEFEALLAEEEAIEAGVANAYQYGYDSISAPIDWCQALARLRLTAQAAITYLPHKETKGRLAAAVKYADDQLPTTGKTPMTQKTADSFADAINVLDTSIINKSAIAFSVIPVIRRTIHNFDPYTFMERATGQKETE